MAEEHQMPKQLVWMSPMLGITDVLFRKVYQQFYGGLDGAIAPFLRITDGGGFKDAKFQELDPKNMAGIPVIPQLMCNSSAAFLSAWKILYHEFAYPTVNWNLGCPAPTTAGRGMGCGLMPHSSWIDQILDEVYSQIPVPISIKTRIGYQRSDDIFALVEVFNRYPLHSLVIHPRTGEQGYEGQVDLATFEQVSKMTSHPLFYSGDIRTIKNFVDLTTQFPSIRGFLIGRGLLSDPCLPEKIAAGLESHPVGADHRYLQFLALLGDEYLRRNLGVKQTLMRLRTLWAYYASARGFSSRSLKAVRKAQSLELFLAEAQRSMEEVANPI